MASQLTSGKLRRIVLISRKNSLKLMKYIYNNRSKNPLTWFLVLFSMVYIAIACIIIVQITCAIIDSDGSGFKVKLLFIPALILLVAWALDLILWQITGKEILEFTEEGIMVSHSGRVFRYKKFVPAKSISKITNECNQSDVLRDFWIPKWQPKIKVTYNYDDSIRIGRNLSKEECEKLLSELQDFYPDIKINANLAPHKLTINEIFFIIWAVGSIFLFIPAWFVVPILQEKQNNDRIEKYTERMSFIRQNYRKMYCYSDAYGEHCCSVSLLSRKDSVYEPFLDKLCHINDSLAHFSIGPYCTPKIMPDNIKMPPGNFFRGVVYVLAEYESMSLIYSNSHIYEPVFVLNRYLHEGLPNCELTDCMLGDLDRMRWDETDDFIRNGSLWKLGIY